MFAAVKVTVPAPDLVRPKPPLMIPEEVNVLPDATFHVWSASRARVLATVRFTVEVAEDMSIPLAPKVSIPAPVMPIFVTAPVIAIPPQDVLLSRVRAAPSEALFQVATSPEPGAVPPQLAPVARSVPAAALVIGAATATQGTKASKVKTRVHLRLGENRKIKCFILGEKILYRKSMVQQI